MKSNLKKAVALLLCLFTMFTVVQTSAFALPTTTLTQAVAKPSQVKNVKATAGTNYVTLTWSKASNTTKYYVFSYNTSTKKYTCLGNTTKLTYKISNLKANTTYRFAVQAARVVSGKNYYGKVSAYVTVKTKAASTAAVAQVTGLKAVAGVNDVTLTWSKALGAQKYGVYSYNTSTKKYTALGSTTKLTYKISKLKPNTTYRFAVQASKVVNKKTYYGKVSAYVTVKTKSAPVSTTPAAITGLKITTSGKSNYLKVSWNAQSRVTGYQVYRSPNGKSGTYQKIATLKNSQASYADTGLKSATPYYYAVRAYTTTAKGTVYGKFAKVDLSTRLTVGELKKIIEKANKCYFDWEVGMAIYDDIDTSDTYYYVDDWGDDGDLYLCVNSDEVKCVKDVEEKMLDCFGQEYCDKALKGDCSNYKDINGKLYIIDPCDYFEEGETLRLDKVQYNDTTCVFTVSIFNEDYEIFDSDYGEKEDLPEIETFVLYYRDGKWVYNDSPLYNYTMYVGGYPWLN